VTQKDFTFILTDASPYDLEQKIGRVPPTPSLFPEYRAVLGYLWDYWHQLAKCHITPLPAARRAVDSPLLE
jgi:hypothetical protein